MLREHEALLRALLQAQQAAFNHASPEGPDLEGADGDEALDRLVMLVDDCRSLCRELERRMRKLERLRAIES